MRRSHALREGSPLGAGFPLVLLVLAVWLAGAAPAGALEPPPGGFPAAGTLQVAKVVVRARPSAGSRIVKRLPQFRPDGRYQIVLALGSTRDGEGRLWYRLKMPMRPNGTTGWARATAFEVETVREQIVIDRSARTLRLKRDGRVLLKTRVAVGAPGSETPLGRFYVAARYRPTDPILGRYALETSAYSKLTDWPGGGIVALHGTNQPWLLGKAVSHGCVRMSNRAVLRLKELVRLGAPIRILR